MSTDDRLTEGLRDFQKDYLTWRQDQKAVNRSQLINKYGRLLAYAGFPADLSTYEIMDALSLLEAHRLATIRSRFTPSYFLGRKQQIHRPPGARLDAFASFVFRKRIYETVLKPCLAETQEEYFEAISQGQMRKAKWIRTRGVITFWSHVGLQMPVSLTRMVQKLWTISGG